MQTDLQPISFQSDRLLACAPMNLIESSSQHPRPLRIVGWREWLSLPQLGIVAVKAKIDTGARSSALHVVWQERFHRDGAPWVRFLLESDGSGSAGVESEAEVVDERNVTDSGGHISKRPFIRTLLDLGGEQWPIEINLADRRHMRFPMLLGRTAMIGRLLVDPSRAFVFGQHEEANS